MSRSAAADRRPSLLRWSAWACVALTGAMLVLALVALYHSSQDRKRIAEMLSEALPVDAAPSEKMRTAVKYIEANVGYGYPEDYYLLPLLRPLRPTALQVLGSEGDCAYRARALIVALDIYGVKASKRAVYNDKGRSVHAVVNVETERGPYVVDMLYNVIHEDPQGHPIPLASLATDPTVLPSSLARAVAAGNDRATKYPLDKYSLGDTRTINWEKSALWRTAYSMLTAILGEEHVKALPRPYLSEEPQLMVAFVAGCGFLFFAVLSLALFALDNRRRRRREAGSAARQAAVHGAR